jgi:hypothetical protein
VTTKKRPTKAEVKKARATIGAFYDEPIPASLADRLAKRQLDDAARLYVMLDDKVALAYAGIEPVDSVIRAYSEALDDLIRSVKRFEEASARAEREQGKWEE